MPRRRRRLAVAFSLTTLLLAALAPAVHAQASLHGWSNAYSNTSRTYGFIYPSSANPSPMIYIENVTFNLGTVNSQYAHVNSVVWKYTVGSSSADLILHYTEGYDNVYPFHEKYTNWVWPMDHGYTYTFTQTFNLNMYWGGTGGTLTFLDSVYSDCCAPADASELDIYYSGTGGG